MPRKLRIKYCNVWFTLLGFIAACTEEQVRERAAQEIAPPEPIEPTAPPPAPTIEPGPRVLGELAAELQRRRDEPPDVGNTGDTTPDSAPPPGLPDQDLRRVEVELSLMRANQGRVDLLLDPGRLVHSDELERLSDDLLHTALRAGFLHEMKSRSIIGKNDIVSPGNLIKEPPPISELAAEYLELRRIMLGTQRHTTMLVKASRITSEPTGKWTLRTTSLYERFDICPEEEYLEDEPSLGDCSGVVLDHNRIVTARHCLDGFRKDGADVRFLFDFVAGADGKFPTSLPAASVFKGTVVARGKGNENDWVIFKTTTDIPADRIPRLSLTPVPASIALFAAGYPLGGPFKLIRRGKFMDLDETRLYTNLDAYQGTSGSPVFNVQGEVEAIIVRGGAGFENHSGCQRTLVCATEKNCKPEEAFRLSAIFRQLR